MRDSFEVRMKGALYRGKNEYKIGSGVKGDWNLVGRVRGQIERWI